MKGIVIFLFLIVGVYFGSQYLGVNPFYKKVNVDLNTQLDFNESDVNSRFSGVGFECATESGNLGDRVCWANVSSFNDLPASMVAFFFKQDKVKYVRVASSGENHSEFKNYVDRQFSYVGISPNSTRDVGQKLGVWLSKSGRVPFTIDIPPKGEETILLWRKTR